MPVFAGVLRTTSDIFETILEYDSAPRMPYRVETPLQTRTRVWCSPKGDGRVTFEQPSGSPITLQ